MCHASVIKKYLMVELTCIVCFDKVLNILKQKSDPEWIEALCFFTSTRKKGRVHSSKAYTESCNMFHCLENCVISLCGSGNLKVWSVDNIENEVGRDFAFATAYKFVDTSKYYCKSTKFCKQKLS